MVLEEFKTVVTEVIDTNFPGIELVSVQNWTGPEGELLQCSIRLKTDPARQFSIALEASGFQQMNDKREEISLAIGRCANKLVAPPALCDVDLTFGFER